MNGIDLLISRIYHKQESEFESLSEEDEYGNEYNNNSSMEEEDENFFTLTSTIFDKVFNVTCQQDNSINKNINKQRYSFVRVILVGINTYDSSGEIESLQGAIHDCEHLSLLFREKNFQIDSTLFNEKATKKDIINAFDCWDKETTEDTLVIFYFAGHGYVHKMKKRRNIYYLCASDFDEEEPKKGGINIDDELKKRAEQWKANHVLFILDCCFGDEKYQEQELCKLSIEKQQRQQQQQQMVMTEEEEKGTKEKKIFMMTTGESKREKMIEQEYRGIFSYHLQQCLDESSKNSIYSSENQNHLEREKRKASAMEIIEHLKKMTEEKDCYPILYSLCTNVIETVEMPIIPCILEK